MVTCYIFAQTMTDEQVFSLCLNEQGGIEAVAQYRLFEELRLLQQHAHTVVVLPSESCSLYELELPWLPERKARAAIPYALEENLAQSVLQLHFAYSAAFYQEKKYLIVVIDKKILQELGEKMDSLGLSYDAVTIEWFALYPGEGFISDRFVQINQSSFKGVMNKELARSYLDSLPFLNLFRFENSSKELLQQNTVELSESYELWLAKRLQEKAYIDLCQGEFKRERKSQAGCNWYLSASILAGIWLLLILVLQISKLLWLDSKINLLDKQIASVYHSFFPAAKQVISPKFRIQQFLKTAGGKDSQAIWFILDKISASFQGSGIDIQQLRYQNQMLSMNVSTKDFSSLEQFQQQLQKTGVKVKQKQAASQDQKVVALLELSL